MSLFVSYQPEGSTGEPIVLDLVFSKSYDEVLKTACEMLKHELPPEERIQDRKLARWTNLQSGSRWVTLHPDRFAQLVEAGSEEGLEFRLQITCIAITTPPRSGSTGTELLSRSPSTLEIPLPYLPPVDGINIGRPPTIAENNVLVEHTPPNSSPTAVRMPLTPISVFSITRGRSSSSGHRQDSSNGAGPPGPSLSPITSRAPVEPKKDNADALFDKGITAFLAGRYPDARDQFQRAAKEFHNRPDLQRKADCLRHLGATCRFLKEYYEARTYLSTAREIYVTLGPSCRQEQLRCDRHLARVAEDSGDTSTALVKYQDLIRVSQQEGLQTQEAWCTYYLGHLFNQIKRYEEALSLLKDAIRLGQRVQNPEIEAFATEDMGYTAERQGHPQLAMECYDKALGLFKTGGNGKWMAHESRVKSRMDQLRRSFPSLLNTVARSRSGTIEKFVLKILSK
ncbi:TPR-like protein [Ceratobasidium sp. AG-I]|nr:TPR-like protein [Ceratobasidium sp. AG-I]